jgi:hypothetical protein
MFRRGGTLGDRYGYTERAEPGRADENQKRGHRFLAARQIVESGEHEVGSGQRGQIADFHGRII